MNELLEDIVATLLADSATTALIDRRLYPDQASQGAATPYLVYQEVSLAGSYNLSGPDGTRSRRIQFDAYATGKADCLTLSERVLALFDGKKQTLGARTEVLHCQIDGAQSGYDPAQRIYRSRIDLTFIYRT